MSTPSLSESNDIGAPTCHSYARALAGISQIPQRIWKSEKSETNNTFVQKPPGQVWLNCLNILEWNVHCEHATYLQRQSHTTIDRVYTDCILVVVTKLVPRLDDVKAWLASTFSIALHCIVRPSNFRIFDTPSEILAWQ